MSDNSDDTRKEPALGSAADRKSWIRFEDRPDGDVGAVDEFKVEMPSPESSGCATIQPTDSIQINATNDYTKRCASPSSPSTHISIGLPLNQSNHTMDANIMSNIESNKVMEKSFIKNNNNNDIHATSGETSHESNVKTLQTVSLKETNNGANDGVRTHSSDACDHNTGRYCKHYMLLV
jgi:hypothetical protein